MKFIKIKFDAYSEQFSFKSDNGTVNTVTHIT